jgi:hypothetical protein
LTIAVFAKALLIRPPGNKGWGHIFNPSAFGLALGSVVILALGLEGVAGGSQLGKIYLNTPHFDLILFVGACCTLWIPRNYWITLGGLVTFVCAEWFAFTLSGQHLMFAFARGSVLLGMTLLITDPKTSPKGVVAKFAFGCAYALTIVFAYGFLVSLRDHPTYYDKILFVPILNIFAPAFDRFFAKWDSSLRSYSFLTRREPWIGLCACALLFFLIYHRLEERQNGPFLMDSVDGWAIRR